MGCGGELVGETEESVEDGEGGFISFYGGGAGEVKGELEAFFGSCLVNSARMLVDIFQT